MRTALTLAAAVVCISTVHPATAQPMNDGRPAFSAAPASAPQPVPKRRRYVEMPLTGAIGEAFDDEGVQAVLTYATAHEAEAVVITLDIPGGSPVMAESVRRALELSAGKLKYHVVVKQAAGAAIWPLVEADVIYAAPGTIIGFPQIAPASGAGDADVSAADRQKLAARAAAHGGLPRVVIEAMLRRTAELWTGVRSDSSREYAEHSITGAALVDVEQLDGPGTLLVLTDKELGCLGLARAASDAPAPDSREWTLVSRQGALILEQNRKTLALTRDAAEKLVNWSREIERLYADALQVKSAGEYQDYTYDRTYSDTDRRVVSSETMTAASAALWADRQAKYRAAWAAVFAGCEDILKLPRGHKLERFARQVAEAGGDAKAIDARVRIIRAAAEARK